MSKVIDTFETCSKSNFQATIPIISKLLKTSKIATYHFYKSENFISELLKRFDQSSSCVQVKREILEILLFLYKKPNNPKKLLLNNYQMDMIL